MSTCRNNGCKFLIIRITLRRASLACDDIGQVSLGPFGELPTALREAR